MNDSTLSRKELKAISSDVRMEILKLLKDRNHTLSELSTKLGLKASTVKEHVSKLLDAEIIEMKDTGHKWKYYSLTRKGEKLTGQETSFLILFSIGLIGFLACGAFLLNFGNLYTQNYYFMSLQEQAPLLAASEYSEGAEKLMTTSAEPAMASVPSAERSSAGTVTENALDTNVSGEAADLKKENLEKINENISINIIISSIFAAVFLALTLYAWIRFRK